MGPTRATGSDSDRCRLLEPSDGHRQHPLRPTFPIQLRELFGCLFCTVKGTACFCAWADRGKYDPGCFVSAGSKPCGRIGGSIFCTSSQGLAGTDGSSGAPPACFVFSPLFLSGAGCEGLAGGHDSFGFAIGPKPHAATSSPN